MRSLPRILLALAPTLLVAPAQAEFFGMRNGRSADLDRLPKTSVEAGFVTGDFIDEREYLYFGARVNYRATPELMLYVDIGQTEIEFGTTDTDGIGFGIGGFYTVEGVFEGSDFALKGSFHRVTVEPSRGTNEVDLDGIVFEAILSGREGIGAGGNLGWYANLGMHRLSGDDGSDDDSETEIGFGGGLVIPNDAGEFYLGIDIIDEMIFGGGFRYFLK